MKKEIAIWISAINFLNPAFAAPVRNDDGQIAQRTAMCNFIYARLYETTSELIDQKKNEIDLQEKSITNNAISYNTAAIRVRFIRKEKGPVIISAKYSKNYFEKKIQKKDIFLKILLKNSFDVKDEINDGCDTNDINIKFLNNEVQEVTISSHYLD